MPRRDLIAYARNLYQLSCTLTSRSLSACFRNTAATEVANIASTYLVTTDDVRTRNK